MIKENIAAAKLHEILNKNLIGYWSIQPWSIQPCQYLRFMKYYESVKIKTKKQFFYVQGTDLLTCFNLIPTCISNHVPRKVWNEITYPFPNFNGFVGFCQNDIFAILLANTRNYQATVVGFAVIVDAWSVISISNFPKLARTNPYRKFLSANHHFCRLNSGICSLSLENTHWTFFCHLYSLDQLNVRQNGRLCWIVSSTSRKIKSNN